MLYRPQEKKQMSQARIKIGNINIVYMISLLLAVKARKNISSATSSLRDLSAQNDLDNSTIISKIQVPGGMNYLFTTQDLQYNHCLQPLKAKKIRLQVSKSRQLPQGKEFQN